jgi:hypothetical protein
MIQGLTVVYLSPEIFSSFYFPRVDNIYISTTVSDCRVAGTLWGVLSALPRTPHMYSVTSPRVLLISVSVSYEQSSASSPE